MDDFLCFKQSSKFRFVPDYPICAWNFFKMQKIKSIKKVKNKKSNDKNRHSRRTVYYRPCQPIVWVMLGEPKTIKKFPRISRE